MPVSFKEVASISEFIDSIRLRVDVFIKEQGFEPGWEPDEDDKSSRHFIAVKDGKAVATARTRETTKGEIKIERMVVDKHCRKKGIGTGLIQFIISKHKGKNLWMEAQLQAQPFYEKCGFAAFSGPYDFYGVQHVKMALKKA